MRARSSAVAGRRCARQRKAGVCVCSAQVVEIRDRSKKESTVYWTTKAVADGPRER